MSGPWKIPLADLDYGPEEEEAVLAVLRSRWLTMGAVTRQFEQAFAEFIGVKHAVAVSNATQGLHLACRALGIGPGDEVILPSLTFVATANAVLYAGAGVVFADITSADNPNISPEDIERKLTPATKAIIVVHYAGYPAPMPDIVEIARRHGLFVIEDAAHAPGAALDGKRVGAWGTVGCFSFFSNKNLATGEGGMATTDDPALAERMRLLRSHGMTSQTLDRHLGHAYSYDVVDLGYNYRIDEIRAALGLVQLKKIAHNNARRRALTEKYWAELAELNLVLPFQGRASQAACHIFPVILPNGVNRQGLMAHLRSAGVQTSIHYPPVHSFQYYRAHYPAQQLPVTEEVASREVTLPLYPGMSDQDAAWIARLVRDGINGAA